MLTIIRTQPLGSVVAKILDASVSLRKGNENIEGCPDIVFSMKTYNKIASDSGDLVGDRILLPINLFFVSLSDIEHREIYNMYAFAKQSINTMTADNRREVQDALQGRIFDTIHQLDLGRKMIEFCRTSRFSYPDLSMVGTAAHHSREKSFFIEDYIEITAISLLSKMMVPIWGEFVKVLGNIGVANEQREKLAFDLIESTLDDGAFERIYNKLMFSLSSLVAVRREIFDGKAKQNNNAQTSFILTHSGVDDMIFNQIVMATIVVKRMASYECFTRPDGTIPNAMVYIDDGIKKTADTKVGAMRSKMRTMPYRELTAHDTEDNSSILDHTSRTSKKPIDVPVMVTIAVEYWELDKLLSDTQTSMAVYESAVEYYRNNPFDVSPLCQAMVASFIGTRFGGSKCLGYLPPNLYQRVVAILQVWLVGQEMYDLAAMVSARTSSLPIDAMGNPIAMRIRSRLETPEYGQCMALFRGYLEKPVSSFVKKSSTRRQEVDKIDFKNHIDRMVDWLVKYSHTENMAPALWDFSRQENRPIAGEDCRYDENLIRNLCRFYLLFHSGQRPF